MMRSTARDNGAFLVNAIALLTLWLAPLPAAFFVGRSVYWHLIHNWHLDLGPWGIVPAVLAGAMIELVGLLSAHVALAAARWNRKGQVRKATSHWERAPVWLAAGCFVTYCVSAFLLAVVLEAAPEFATLAPALFTLMAAAAYLTIGVYEQHRDRLAYYGLAWNWKAVKDEPDERATESDAAGTAPDAEPDRFNLDNLDRAILRTFRSEPDASYRTVAESVGSVKSTVGGRIGRLAQAGLLARTAQGWDVRWSDNGKGHKGDE